MTLLIVVVIASILTLILVLTLLKDQNSGEIQLDALAAQLKPIDVRAFRNLVDENEREYLRHNLSSSDFRSIQRERMKAASEYVRCATFNAGILIRLGEAARHSTDPELAAAGGRLQENAAQFRLHAIGEMPRLYVSMLIPSVSWSSGELPEICDRLHRQAVILGCMRISDSALAGSLQA